MFFQFTEDGMTKIAPENISSDVLTAGYLSTEELADLNGYFLFDESTINACKDANKVFRSGVEVHSDYTFTELRILNENEENDDYIALYVKKNLILVVDISDADGSTKKKYLSSISRYSIEKISCEKIMAAFFDSLLARDYAVLEKIENELAEQEEIIFRKEFDKDFNIDLLQIKKLLSKRYAYYTQLLDIADAVYENDNDIFDENNLIYIDNISKRITRLREDTANMRNSVEHLQDAYSSQIDSSMNNTMKILTVLTSIFFPLTIIVGWYGMNFQHMPELTWKYGYVYVIVLSVVTLLVFAFIGKKKKWF